MTRSEGRNGNRRAALIAIAFFGLGLLAARLLGPSPPASPSSTESPADAGPPRAPALIEDAGGPRIFFDPSSISLLPDASLELVLPKAPDAGLSAP